MFPRPPLVSGAAPLSLLISLLHGQSDYSTSDILNKLPSMRLFICSFLEELQQFSLCEAAIDSEDSANYHSAAAGGVMNCVAFSSLPLHEYTMSSWPSETAHSVCVYRMPTWACHLQLDAIVCLLWHVWTNRGILDEWLENNASLNKLSTKISWHDHWWRLWCCSWKCVFGRENRAKMATACGPSAFLLFLKQIFASCQWQTRLTNEKEKNRIVMNKYLAKACKVVHGIFSDISIFCHFFRNIFSFK